MDIRTLVGPARRENALATVQAILADRTFSYWPKARQDEYARLVLQLGYRISSDSLAIIDP